MVENNESVLLRYFQSWLILFFKHIFSSKLKLIQMIESSFLNCDRITQLLREIVLWIPLLHRFLQTIRLIHNRLIKALIKIRDRQHKILLCNLLQMLIVSLLSISTLALIFKLIVSLHKQVIIILNIWNRLSKCVQIMS